MNVSLWICRYKEYKICDVLEIHIDVNTQNLSIYQFQNIIPKSIMIASLELYLSYIK